MMTPLSFSCASFSKLTAPLQHIIQIFTHTNTRTRTSKPYHQTNTNTNAIHSVPAFVTNYVESLAEATGFDSETINYTLGLFACYPWASS